MKKLLVLALAAAAIYAGITLTRRSKVPSGDPTDLDQWEGEGGAVPVDDGQRTAAQTAPAAS